MANIFKRDLNLLPFKVLLILGLLGGVTFAGFWHWWTPAYTRVGYQPSQPVPFSHKIHSGQLGIDCRYCHTAVETAAHSNVPPTQTCMNCHTQVQSQNPKLQPVRESWKSGKPMQWVQIHKTPDYVYFNHAVHVNRGVSCVSCHGDVTEMDVVYHHQEQSMGWCLECHRAPEKHLRPLEHVFDLKWKPTPNVGETVEQAQIRIGLELKNKRGIHAPDSNCAGCHR